MRDAEGPIDELFISVKRVSISIQEWSDSYTLPESPLSAHNQSHFQETVESFFSLNSYLKPYFYRVEGQK